MEDLTEIMEKGRLIGRANYILTPELSAEIGAVHGTYLGSKGIMVAARDYANNSRMLKRAYIAGEMSAGIDVLNLHSAPLPLVQFCIRRFGASGGVYFSSGHTYTGNTAIRFFDSSGIEFSPKHINSMNEYFKNKKITRVEPLSIGSLSSILQTFEVYKKTIPQFIDKKLIESKKLKVVIDCSYGPTGELAPEILNSINTQVIALNTYYRPLANKMYPNLESIREAAAIIKASGSDMGAIFDTDGSRMLLLDETGNIVEFEDLLMLFISNDDSILKSNMNPIITTTGCSRILEDYAGNLEYHIKRIKNMPGEISQRLREDRGCFGAADTYKFYFPQYGPFSDAVFTLMKILEIVAKKGEPLSSLIRNFPKTIKTHKMINTAPEILQTFDKKIKEKLKIEDVVILDTILGMKIVYGEGTWVSVAPSLYRDAIVFSSEAPDTKTSESLIKQIEQIIVPSTTNAKEKAK